MSRSGLVADPLDGSEPVWLRQGGQWKFTTVGAIAKLSDGAMSPIAARVDALERALGIETGARTTAAVQVEARLAVIEARAEEVAHFTGTVRLPAISALGTAKVSLLDLKPERAGDVIRSGETVAALPRAALPSGASIASAIAAADGVVTLQVAASVAIAAGTTIPFSVLVLR